MGKPTATDRPRLPSLSHSFTLDFVILINGTKEEAIDQRNKVAGVLETLGLTLSVEKTRITHWSEPVNFLGYHIHGEIRPRGVQIRAILSIPKEKERLIRRELLKVASYHHIPEIDAMLSMNAKFRGWSNYYKYANTTSEVFERVSRKMWWFYAHFLARKQRQSIRKLLTWAHKAGRRKVVGKGEGRRDTFIIPVGKKEQYLDIFPPRTAEIKAVPNSETWTVDLKPVIPTNWTHGRSAATRLTALAKNDGICERCGENPAQQVHHPNRMRTKRTLRARVASDKDQQQQAKALCKECHLEEHHGKWQD